jgi:sugar lactone lactonase YvrE
MISCDAKAHDQNRIADMLCAMQALIALPLFVPFVVSATLPTRQSSGATTVWKASGSAWYENLAVRSNGQILLSRMDTNEVWTLDPTTKSASKLLSVPGVTSLAGITETTPDVFALVGGNYSSRGGGNTPGSWGVFSIDLSSATPKATVVKMIKEAQQFNGLTTVNNDTVLIGDTAKGLIYSLKLSTGDYAVAVQDDALVPASAGFGVDGLRYRDGYAYFTNIFKNTLGKVPVDATTGKSTGKVTLLYSDSSGDDLTFDADGNIYVATNSGGRVLKVTSDGKHTVLASGISSDTACMFGRKDKDKNLLYVTTSTGSVSAVTVK